MSIKYTFFLKTGKNVVLTDDENQINIDKVISELTSILKSPKICLFSTKTDCVLLKSNEVQGVMIDSKNINFKESKISHIDNENINIPIDSVSTEEIDIEDYTPDIELNDIYEEYEIDDINEISNNDTIKD